MLPADPFEHHLLKQFGVFLLQFIHLLFLGLLFRLEVGVEEFLLWIWQEVYGSVAVDEAF